MNLVEVIALAILIGLSAFFSASETALVSVGRLGLRTALKKRKRGAEALQQLKMHPNKMIMTALIGNNLVNASASVLSTYIATQLFGEIGFGIAVGSITLFLLVFGEITPKTIAASNAEKLALAVAPTFLLLQKMFSPLITTLEAVMHFVPKKYKTATYYKKYGEEEIKMAAELGVEDKRITEADKKFIESAFQFNDFKASDLMTPADNVSWLDAELTAKKALERAVKTRFHALPVYDKNAGKAIGVIDVNVLVKKSVSQPERKISSLAKKAVSVLENAPASTVLDKMKQENQRMIIVTNKNNSLQGIITLKDVIDEIG